MQYDSPRAGAKVDASPFVKWAGGKTQLLADLDARLPLQFSRYYEPFLGGGAFYFHLASQRKFLAFLSDANIELIATYTTVKRDVHTLIAFLKKHEANYTKDPVRYYYSLRAAKPRNRLAIAARFIALNKTCYNGLYRVNKSGIFNVPIGRYEDPTICDREQLYNASLALNDSMATIVACDYKQGLKNARKGDFVYLDPPFYPISSTANFVDYTKQGFAKRDQVELASMFNELDNRGCQVLLSNSDTELTRQLYSEFKIDRVLVKRAINCKAVSRSGHAELLIYNYVSR
jgi:DNA adenine methylase